MRMHRARFALLALMLLGDVASLWGQPPGKDARREALPDGALLRVGTLRLRHQGEVSQLRFTADGRQIASVGKDHVFALWDAKTGAEIRRMMLADDGGPATRPLSAQEMNIELMLRQEYGRHFSGNAVAALSRDAGLLAVSKHGKVRIIEVLSGKTVFGREFKDERHGVVAVSSDGKMFARLIIRNNYQTELVLAETKDGKRKHQLRVSPGEIFHTLVFSADNKLLAGAGAGNLTNVWDTVTGKRVRRLESADYVTTLCLSPRDNRIAGATSSGVFFWDKSSEEEDAKLPLTEVYNCAAAFSPDGATLATSGPNNLILLWDIAKKAIKSRLAGGRTPTQALAFSPDGTRLASACQEGTLHLWDLAALREITPVEHRPKYTPISFVGEAALVQSGTDAALQRLDGANGKVLSNLVSPPRKPTSGVQAVSATGKYLARADLENNSIQLWDLEKNKELPRLLGHGNFATHMRFSADSRYLATLDANRNLRVWNPAAGAKEVHNLNLAPMQDELIVAVQFRNRNMMIHQNAAQMQNRIPLAVADDSRFFAALNQHGTAVSLWEMTTGKERGRFALGSGGVSLLALSPDGRLLATVANDDVVRVWDTLRGKMLHGFIYPQADVRALAFSPSSKLLAAGAGDGTVILFDLAEGRERRRFQGHRNAVNTVLFDPADKTILSAADDGTMIFWDANAPAPAPPPSAPELKEPRIAELWSELALADPADAYRAMGELSDHPTVVVKFLARQMKPVAAVAPARLQQLLSDLHNPNYALRDLASQELVRLGTQVVPALESTIRDNTSAEAKRRAKEIIAKLDEQTATPENLRLARGVELLERIGGHDALLILERLSNGAPHARLTTASAVALKRSRGGR